LAVAKLKAFLRAARPRSFDQVCALIATAIDLFSPPNATTSCDIAAIAYLQGYEKRFWSMTKTTTRTDDFDCQTLD
jgi:hypothetical protein